MTASVLACALVPLAYGAGSVLQAAAADGRGTVQAVVRPGYVVGVLLDLGGFLASVVALRELPLFLVQAAVAAGLAVTVVLARLVLGTRSTTGQLAALGVLWAGLLLVATSAVEASAVPPSAHALFVPGLVAVAVVVALAARRQDALATGLLFAGTAVAARLLVVPRSLWHLVAAPLAWVVAGCGVAGTLLYARALTTSAVTRVTAVVVGLETVLPAAAGALLHDPVRPGRAPRAVLGVLLVLGAVLGAVRTADPEALGAPG